MRSLHIDEQRGWRGGEQQASYLMQGLAGLGHEVLLAGRPDAPFVTRDHGAATIVRHALPFRGEWDLLTAYRLAGIIRREQVDIIHAHTSHAHTIACIARQLAGRGKVVVSRRVDFPPKSHAFNRWKYAWPDQYIAISETIGRILREWGVPGEKLSVVHSAIDPSRFEVEPMPRADLGVPEGVPLVGIVAAFVGHKDLPTFIDAMAAVNAERPEVHALIVGDGPLRAEVEARIRAKNLLERVHLLGYRDDVPAILRALDVFVLSSNEEGLGTSILDAMAAGVPVAATAAGGIPEMVIDGETGLLAAIGDGQALGKAILRLLGHPESAAALTANAHRMLDDRFTLPRMVEGNLAVYKKLVGV